MEHHADVDAVRKKAIAFLHNLLERSAGQSSLQTAEGIVNLAFDDSNPVKDVFGAASTNDRPSTAQPTSTLSSWLGSKFPRRENKHATSESKPIGSVAQVCDPQSMPPGTSALYAEIFGDPPFDKSAQTNQSKKSRSRSIGRAGTAKVSTKSVPNSSVFSSSPSNAKPSSSAQYKCIFCQDTLSSKGVCKRHIEEQHVTPKVFKCEKCGQRFDVKKEAKAHTNACGQGVFLYTIGKQEEKKVYGCEFTGESFVSKSKYLEHLLLLSEMIEDRPEPNMRLKLCGLLNQPALQSQVAEISCRKFESRHAWKNLVWSDAHIAKAIEELEDATVHENGNIEFGKAHAHQKAPNARVYLNSLLCAGNLPRSNSTHSRRSASSTQTQRRRSPHEAGSGRATPTPDAKAAPHLPGNQYAIADDSAMEVSASMPPPETVIASMSAEARKRHLSGESRAFVPSRHPPGPPIYPHMPFAVSPSMPDLHHQQHSSSNMSTTSLPFRTQEGHNMMSQPTADMNPLRTASTATPTLSSDAASESTLMSSYHEPEFIDQQIPFGYNNLWNPQQSVTPYNFNFGGNNMDFSIPSQYLYTNAEPSIRTSSIATDRTLPVDFSEPEQKMLQFEPIPLHNTAQLPQTFFIDDDDFHDSHGLN